MNVSQEDLDAYRLSKERSFDPMANYVDEEDAAIVTRDKKSRK